MPGPFTRSPRVPSVATQPPLSLPMMLQSRPCIRRCMPNEITESKLPLTHSVSKVTASAVLAAMPPPSTIASAATSGAWRRAKP